MLETTCMDYHIGRDGQQLGSFSEEQILIGLQDGSLRNTDLAWTEGMRNWEPIGALPPFRPTPSERQAMTANYVDPQFHHMAPGASSASNLATASLICGILSLFSLCCCLGWPLVLAAVICGHMALAEIDNNPSLSNSRGIAIAGLVMGYFSIALGVAGMMFGIVSHSFPK
jgi:hypothetical protein